VKVPVAQHRLSEHRPRTAFDQGSASIPGSSNRGEGPALQLLSHDGSPGGDPRVERRPDAISPQRGPRERCRDRATTSDRKSTPGPSTDGVSPQFPSSSAPIRLRGFRPWASLRDPRDHGQFIDQLGFPAPTPPAIARNGVGRGDSRCLHGVGTEQNLSDVLAHRIWSRQLERESEEPL
jgi:hypothetical protein